MCLVQRALEASLMVLPGYGANTPPHRSGVSYFVLVPAFFPNLVL